MYSLNPICSALSLICIVGMSICYILMVLQRNEAVGKLTQVVNRMMEVKTSLNEANCPSCAIAHHKLNEAIEELKE